jgi:hypothetical protein
MLPIFFFLLSAFIVFKILKGVLRLIVIALLVGYASMLLVNVENPDKQWGITSD